MLSLLVSNFRIQRQELSIELPLRFSPPLGGAEFISPLLPLALSASDYEPLLHF